MKLTSEMLLCLAPLCGLSLTLLSGWPGAVSVDMLDSILEGDRFQFSGHQAPACGLIWAVLQSILPARVGVMFMFAVQCLLYWASWWMLARSLWLSSSRLLAFLVSILGFLPPLMCFVPAVESNIQLGVAWLAATAVAASFRSRVGAFGCCLLLFYGAAVRSGAVVALAPLAFSCLILMRPGWAWRKALLWSLVCTATFQCGSLLIEKTLLGVSTRDRVLSVSMVFDMAAVYRKTGRHEVPDFMVPQGHTADEVLVNFDPKMVGPLFWRDDQKPVFVLPEGAEQGALVRQAWIRTVRAFPKEWVAWKCDYAMSFLLIGEEWAGGIWVDYGANERLGLNRPGHPRDTLLGAYASATASNWVWRGWFLTGCALLTVVFAHVRGARRVSAAYAAFVAAICTMLPHMVFGQAVFSRYYFPTYALLLSASALAGLGAWGSVGSLHKKPSSAM